MGKSKVERELEQMQQERDHWKRLARANGQDAAYQMGCQDTNIIWTQKALEIIKEQQTRNTSVYSVFSHLFAGAAVAVHFGQSLTSYRKDRRRREAKALAKHLKDLIFSFDAIAGEMSIDESIRESGCLAAEQYRLALKLIMIDREDEGIKLLNRLAIDNPIHTAIEQAKAGTSGGRTNDPELDKITNALHIAAKTLPREKGGSYAVWFYKAKQALKDQGETVAYELIETGEQNEGAKQYARRMYARRKGGV